MPEKKKAQKNVAATPKPEPRQPVIVPEPEEHPASASDDENILQERIETWRATLWMVLEMGEELKREVRDELQFHFLKMELRMRECLKVTFLGSEEGGEIQAAAQRHEQRMYAHSVSTQTPTPPARTYAAAAVQTPPPVQYATAASQTPTVQRKSTATDAPPTPPTRRYAAAAVQTPPATAAVQTPPQREQGRQVAPQRAQKPPRGDKGAPPTTRALVMHAAPLKYKPGTTRRWIEEDNKGVKMLGIRWLLREDRRGQVASSLVIYMRDLMEVTKLRMGRRLFRTTFYGWDRDGLVCGLGVILVYPRCS